jgi:hypothetical protein
VSHPRSCFKKEKPPPGCFRVLPRVLLPATLLFAPPIGYHNSFPSSRTLLLSKDCCIVLRADYLHAAILASVDAPHPAWELPLKPPFPSISTFPPDYLDALYKSSGHSLCCVKGRDFKTLSQGQQFHQIVFLVASISVESTSAQYHGKFLPVEAYEADIVPAYSYRGLKLDGILQDASPRSSMLLKPLLANE